MTLAEDENEDSSAPDTASIESLFILLMSWLYQQRNFTPEMLTAEEVQRFINAHTEYLNKAVETALVEVPLDEISVQRLKESNYVFSGIKTFHELNEAFPSLLDSEGNLIPFNQFLNSVQTINKSYNGQYLKVEYEFAKSSAYMAARWKEFEKDGEDYYLQYRTAGDARVRRTHQKLHGITLPITSKFWDKYFPPNGWNCRCTVVQVRKDKYPLSDETQAMNLGSQATAGKHQEMFMYNPGKKMTTFPAYNAYTISRCKECPYSGGSIKLAKVPDNELCQACKVVREMKKDNNKSEIQESIQTIISQLENGYPKGESLIIGQLSGDIKEFVRKKGIELISDDIYISDKQIRHALRPVKQKAGKAVTAEQLAAFPALMEDCEVYWDETAGNIQFITRQDGKVQKFVVSLNYITKILGEKKMVNAFITAGTLEERNLGMRNLVKIK